MYTVKQKTETGAIVTLATYSTVEEARGAVQGLGDLGMHGAFIQYPTQAPAAQMYEVVRIDSRGRASRVHPSAVYSKRAAQVEARKLGSGFGRVSGCTYRARPAV